ncbi:HTH_Tnp_Tc3_2 domain-containing protein [Trichonephila clavipes]|nr:HTH_Tnp_Tc3_2 domain-containing protein [Trichonephila clavipes]
MGLDFDSWCEKNQVRIPVAKHDAWVGYLSVTEKMPRRGIRANYEQLSEFERGHIIELEEVGWANRRIARHMGQSNAAIRKCWQEWVENGRFQVQD